MEHFAGLDVSVKETSVCIVDDAGKIVREVKVASEPEALLPVLANGAYRFKRIGLEAGPLSQWLFSALAEAGLPVICVEARHMRAVLKAQINKTDRNDARGIAQMMRAGLYRPVHVKTLRSQKLRMWHNFGRMAEYVVQNRVREVAVGVEALHRIGESWLVEVGVLGADFGADGAVVDGGKVELVQGYAKPQLPFCSHAIIWSLTNGIINPILC